ncbi:MAG: glycosyltransferase [Oscillospiraceae bacterium]|nr:glycosyltransferase [Oscillospiraceae bacterium]
MKKKKLFIYIHQCILKGGVEKVFYNLLNNLPQEQYEITVLSHIAYLTDDIHAELYPQNVHRRWLYYDEFAPGGIRRFLQRVHNFLMPRLYPIWLRFRRFDTAIAAQEGKYARFVDENLRADRKLLWIHNDMERCHWTAREFSSLEEEKNCYLRFDKVVCVSHSVADSMAKVFGEMKNLHVCYNPIDTAEIDRKMDLFPVEREVVPLFVAVGRLAEQKGFDRLLRICRRLNRQGFDYRLWIIGDGEERKKLEAEISKGGLENVRLLGQKGNVFPYMKAADWLVCSSRHEGFNMVLYEAAWCGTPAITTDNAGTREFLGDSQYGIVTDNDEDALYEAMCRVLSNPELLPRYRAAVQERRSFIDLPGRIRAICDVL